MPDSFVQWRNRYQQVLKGCYEERELLNLFHESLTYAGLDRIALLLRPDEPLAQMAEEKLYHVLKELESGKPLQHITGRSYFDDHELFINEHVLIPRPETEELVEWIKQRHPEGSRKKAMDIGTGSGCIALSLAAHYRQWEVLAVDVSEDALQVARENSKRLQLENLSFLRLDVLNEDLDIHSEWDLIVSNPPYIPLSEKGSMHERVTLYEPAVALFVPDQDPLLFYRRLAEMGKKLLKEGGELFVEIHEQLSAEVLALFHTFEFHQIECRKDLQNKDRMIRAVC